MKLNKRKVSAPVILSVIIIMAMVIGTLVSAMALVGVVDLPNIKFDMPVDKDSKTKK